MVTILLQDYHKNDLNTFSAVYNQGQDGDETMFITEYRLLLKNMFFIHPDEKTLESDLRQFVRAQSEPIPTTSPYAQFKVMELAKGKVVVTLDGQGADEQLAGYHYFYGFFFKDLLYHGKIGQLITEIICYLKIHKSLLGIKTFFYFLLPQWIRTKARVKENNYLMPGFAKTFNATNTIAGNLYGSASLKDALLDHFEYKLEHLLKWEDRNSMWFSLEARVPFLDYRLVEKALATSGDFVIKKGMTKHLLREAMKGQLSEKIRMRLDKMGFGTPEQEWFRTERWQKIIFSILESNSFRERNLINQQTALHLYKKHVSGKINISKEIWKWVHLELWFREYID